VGGLVSRCRENTPGAGIHVKANHRAQRFVRSVSARAPAIQTLADFWTNTLQPALATVWAFIQGSVIPILQEVLTWLATGRSAEAIAALRNAIYASDLPGVHRLT
jgi:hypothetical protein